MKDKIIYDSTDADTIAASDKVGAYTLDGVGNPISSTGGALDVNITNSINVALDGVYDGVVNTDPDNVGIVAHIRDLAPADAMQIFRSTGGTANADAVVAAQVQALDMNGFGMLYNGATWDRQKGTSGAAHIHDGGNSITVDAVNLDIRDLTFAADKVDVSGSTVALDAGTLAALETITVLQGTSPWVIGDGGGSITVDGTVAVTQSTSPWVVSDAALANTGYLVSANAIVDAEEALLAAQLANRKYLYVQNHGNLNGYIINPGGSAAVGLRLGPGTLNMFRAGPAISLKVLSDIPAGTSLRTLEFA